MTNQNVNGKALNTIKHNQSNWLRHYQEGGNMESNDITAQIAQLVQAAIQGDLQALQQIEQIMKAAQQGDQQAIQIAQLIQQLVQQMQQEVPSAKCGKKLKKKPLIKKKACGGKTPVKKAACGCKTKLAKIGGRLIEVDCNGIPVAKCGCKIKKGEGGLDFSTINRYGLNSAYTKPITNAPQNASEASTHYYMGDDNNWYSQTWTPGTNGAEGSWSKGVAANINDVTNYFTNDAGAGMNRTVKDGVFVNGYNPQTNKFNSVETANAALGNNQQFMQSNTGNYGFTTIRNNSVDGNPIIGATLADNPERMARQQLRQDRRDARNFAKRYSTSAAEKRDLKNKFGLNSGKTIGQLMRGKGDGNSWLAQRAESAQAGINTAKKTLQALQMPSMQADMSTTTGTNSIATPPVYMPTGKLFYQKGGSVNKDKKEKKFTGRIKFNSKKDLKDGNIYIYGDSTLPNREFYFDDGLSKANTLYYIDPEDDFKVYATSNTNGNFLSFDNSFNMDNSKLLTEEEIDLLVNSNKNFANYYKRVGDQYFIDKVTSYYPWLEMNGLGQEGLSVTQFGTPYDLHYTKTSIKYPYSRLNTQNNNESDLNDKITTSTTAASSTTSKSPTFMSWLQEHAKNYTSVASRRKLAESLGLKDYDPTKAASNMRLWNLMKNSVDDKGNFIFKSPSTTTVDMSKTETHSIPLQDLEKKGIVIDTNQNNTNQPTTVIPQFTAEDYMKVRPSKSSNLAETYMDWRNDYYTPTATKQRGGWLNKQF